MKIVDCVQCSPEWFDVRIGMPTASNYKKIITSTGKSSSTQATYIHDLLAEHITGGYLESFKTEWMERGNELEKEARLQYEFIRNVDVEQVGFCLHDNNVTGCSPDGMVGKDGLIEIKCPKASTMIGYYLKGFPSEYKQQVQGQMWITGRKWCDFYAYHPEMKPFMIRVDRDEDYIKLLSEKVLEFIGKVDKLKEQLKGWKTNE